MIVQTIWPQQFIQVKNIVDTCIMVGLVGHADFKLIDSLIELHKTNKREHIALEN